MRLSSAPCSKVRCLIKERDCLLYDLLLSRPELAAVIEQELMRATYQELRDYN